MKEVELVKISKLSKDELEQIDKKDFMTQSINLNFEYIDVDCYLNDKYDYQFITRFMSEIHGINTYVDTKRILQNNGMDILNYSFWSDGFDGRVISDSRKTIRLGPKELKKYTMSVLRNYYVYREDSVCEETLSDYEGAINKCLEGLMGMPVLYMLIPVTKINIPDLLYAISDAYGQIDYTPDNLSQFIISLLSNRNQPDVFIRITD